ncbi:hypothetical protein SKAU_G00184090, partial [Synaphobranchus kaupii]
MLYRSTGWSFSSPGGSHDTWRPLCTADRFTAAVHTDGADIGLLRRTGSVVPGSPTAPALLEVSLTQHTRSAGRRGSISSSDRKCTAPTRRERQLCVSFPSPERRQHTLHTGCPSTRACWRAAKMR